MKVSLDEGAVLKLSSLYAGGAAAAALIAPNKFQDTIYDTIVPRASLSVTRHHGIVLAGLSALAAAAVPADRSTQRAALKAAGATWLAQGVLNVYETADGQTDASNGQQPRRQRQHAPLAAAARLCGAAAAAAVLLAGGPALARETVAEFATSGLIFRDTVKIVELDDDKVQGLTVYLTDYQRSITERLAKDPFGDPSQASLTCVASGPVTIKDEAAISGSEGKEIFSERKGLNLFQNKNLRVRRIFDEKNRVIIYVAYSTRFTGAADEKEVSTSRYRTSVCAVPLATPAIVEVAGVAAAPPVAQ